MKNSTNLTLFAWQESLNGKGCRSFTRRQEEILKQSINLALPRNQESLNGEGSLDTASQGMDDATDLTVFTRPEILDGLSKGERNQTSSQSRYSYRGILATHPAEFSNAAGLVSTDGAKANPEFTMTNRGLRISISLRADTSGFAFMPLNCHASSSPSVGLGILLGHQGGGIYKRAHPERLAIESAGLLMAHQTIYVTKHVSEKVERPIYQIHRHAFVIDLNFKCNRISFISARPKELWDRKNWRFITWGAPNFTGTLLFWARNMNASGEQFVVAFGYDESLHPWYSIDKKYGRGREPQERGGEPLRLFQALTGDLPTVAKIGKAYECPDKLHFSTNKHSGNYCVRVGLKEDMLDEVPIFRVRIIMELEDDNDPCIVS